MNIQNIDYMINEPFSKTARKSFVKIIWPRTYFVVTVVWIFTILSTAKPSTCSMCHQNFPVVKCIMYIDCLSILSHLNIS